MTLRTDSSRDIALLTLDNEGMGNEVGKDVAVEAIGLRCVEGTVA